MSNHLLTDLRRRFKSLTELLAVRGVKVGIYGGLKVGKTHFLFNRIFADFCD